MLQEFIGKKVVAELNVWTSSTEGELLAFDDVWIKINEKRKIVLVRIEEITRITVSK